MFELKNARVLLTGSGGMLGQHVHDEFLKAGAAVLCNSSEIDLTQTDLGVGSVVMAEPDLVIHCAGFNGGIAFNAKNAARIFRDNTLMALNLLHGCVEARVKKFVGVVASCAYPQFDDWSVSEQRFPEKEVCREEDFFDGETNPTVSCHGEAKRNLQLACKFYNRQYGLNAVCACPPTLYGPFDRFDPERGKFVAALIKKIVDAKERGTPYVQLWGTGKPLREVLFVEDAAKLLVQVSRYYDDPTLPLNIGVGHEVSVMDLALKIAESVKYTGGIVCDTSKPDGQYRKRLDLTRMGQTLPGIEATPLEEGLRRTIDWYVAARRRASDG